MAQLQTSARARLRRRGCRRESGDPVSVGIGEPQLRPGRWAFLAQDPPGAGGPFRQVNQDRWPRLPRPRRGWRRRTNCLIPRIGDIEGVDRVADGASIAQPSENPTPWWRHTAANPWVAPAESERIWKCGACRLSGTAWSSRRPHQTRAGDPPTTERPRPHSPHRRPSRRPDRRTRPRGACVHGPRHASANAAVTGTDTPLRSATSRNTPAPVCDNHAMSVRRHLHPTQRRATVHLESPFPLAIMDPHQASSFRAGQALSLPQAPSYPEFRDRSRQPLIVKSTKRSPPALPRSSTSSSTTSTAATTGYRPPPNATPPPGDWPPGHRTHRCSSTHRANASPRNLAVPRPARLQESRHRRPTSPRGTGARAASHLRHRARQLRDQRLRLDESAWARIDVDLTTLRGCSWFAESACRSAEPLYAILDDHRADTEPAE
jgi:hypothetical protein